MSVEITVLDPERLGREDWEELQLIERDGMTATMLGREIPGSDSTITQDDIDYLARMHEFEDFYESHLYPNVEVGRRFRDNQSFSRPRVAVATVNNEFVGWGFAALNVSGEDERTRRVKQLTVVKNHLHLRDLATDPDFQRQHIATRMARSLVEDAFGLHPVSAYYWPELLPHVAHIVEDNLGMTPSGSELEPVKIFGEDRPAVGMERAQTRSAFELIWHMRLADWKKARTARS